MEGGRGGMTVMHITYKSAFDWVYAEQWYVIITVDVTWNPGVTHKETARS